MKMLSKIVLALVTLGSCAAATAQMSDQADKERRLRNREEAIAHHERTMRGNASTSRETREDAQGVRGKTHKAAQSTRSFTHRQLNSVRNFGERQQRRFPNKGTVQEPNKAPAALGK